ncbi:MAG: 1,4-alpha-glucan branching protein domain-containing protein, partial [Candidatus Xenobia bacterium]
WDRTENAELENGRPRDVSTADNWYFRGLLPGHVYEGRLLEVAAEKTQILAVSEPLEIARVPDRITLLPIDSWRLWCYWSLSPEPIVARLVEKHHCDPNQVKTYVRVFSEFHGQLHHHMEMDFGFHMGHTDNWFMNVQPDRQYRVQVIAVINDSVVEELTEISNPAQTGREHPGSNPIVYHEPKRPVVHPTVRPLQSVRDTSERSIGLQIVHLHAHMPFIPGRINYGTTGFWRPGGYPEEWYHEAVRETYIPLIETFDALINEGVDFKMSMDISPTLTAMMRSPMHQDEFVSYIERLIVLARAEVERTRREEPWFSATAQMHLDDFQRCRDVFLGYQRDLTRAFKKFQDAGVLEISTCAATHAFLPLWMRDPEAIRAQMQTAWRSYHEIFGRAPNGIWLPECAYTPGLEKFLDQVGYQYFFSETETVNRADAHAELTWHAPVYVRGADVAVFPRDYETGRIVWSQDEGYPGDPDYLEFHIRGGPFKYNRITDRKTGRWKQPYEPDAARHRAAQHAQHFMENRNFRFEYLRGRFFKKPLSVACYDAELFGHHWYEGPLFLYYLLKKLYYDQDQTELCTPSTYLARYRSNQAVFPNTSSWGEEGTFKKWMGGNLVWLYRQGGDAIPEMIRIAHAVKEKAPSAMALRLAKQADRELLLAMNSDVPFVISNAIFVDRMRQMTIDNLEAFYRLANMFWQALDGHPVDEVFLQTLEYEHAIFPLAEATDWA